MIRTRLVAMTIVTLGFATGAYAQSLEDAQYAVSPRPRPMVRMDPLDPVSRVALLAAIGNGSSMNVPRTTPERVVYVPAQQTPTLIAQQEPTPNITEEKSSGPSRFYSILDGISAGLQVSHEALDVYEHTIEANALKNFLSGR